MGPIGSNVVIAEPSSYQVLRVSLVGLTNAYIDREGKTNEQRVAEDVALIMRDIGLGHYLMSVRRETLIRAGYMYRGVQMKCFLDGNDLGEQDKFEQAVQAFLQHFCIIGKGEAHMTIGNNLYRFWLRSR